MGKNFYQFEKRKRDLKKKKKKEEKRLKKLNKAAEKETTPETELVNEYRGTIVEDEETEDTGEEA